MYSPRPVDFLKVSNQSGRDNGLRMLSLRKLEPLACALLPVLLALFDAGISRDETSTLERGTKVGIVFEQGSRDAVTDRPGLACRATAGNVDDEIKLVRSLSQLQWLTNDHPQRFIWEIAFERLVIDLNFAGAGSQVNSGGCRFAPSYRNEFQPQ